MLLRHFRYIGCPKSLIQVQLRPTLLIPAAMAALSACADSNPDEPGNIIDVPVPAAAGSAQPNLSRSRDGTVVLSWIEPAADNAALRFATLDAKGWSNPITIASGDRWFVNWADFPSVVKLNEELWASHWLIKRPGGNTYAYDIAIALSHDDGRSWSEPVTPHSDGTPTEHGFVSLYPWQGGAGALWLDGRDMAIDHAQIHNHAGGGMTLRSAVINADGRVSDERLVDGLVCDCCQTDIASNTDGPIAVYRNRTRNEIRDIYVTRFVDGEWEESRPVAEDDWVIGGCPVNGPAIAASDDDVVVAWFTAANDNPKVRLVRSSDRAETFGDAYDVAGDRAIGRVDVVMLANGDAVVSWLQGVADGAGEILIRRISPNGEAGRPATVARTSAGRMSGFPQLAVLGDELVVAWTDVDDDVTTVKSAVVRPPVIDR